MDISLLEQKLARKKTLLEKAYDLQDKILINPKKSYEFDSGDGRVSARFWTLGEVEDLIDRLEASVDSIRQKLNCSNASLFRLRR